jgi:Fe2+ or Zn2+ uptake regulation protein
MKTFKERRAWAMASCRKARMRLTSVRTAILSFLAQRRTPASLEIISLADGVRGQCDTTTVYRTLMMFKDAELIRLVGTPRKASYFVLNAPGDSAHFLICRGCGCVVELPLPDPLSAEIRRLASARGFSPSPSDCEVYGLCEKCQAERKTQIMPSKLIVRVKTSTAHKT